MKAVTARLVLDRFYALGCRRDKEAAQTHEDRQHWNQSKQRPLERFVHIWAWSLLNHSAWRFNWIDYTSQNQMCHNCHLDANLHQCCIMCIFCELRYLFEWQEWRTWKSLRAQTLWWTTEVMCKEMTITHTHKHTTMSFCDDACTASDEAVYSGKISFLMSFLRVVQEMSLCMAYE